MTERSRPAFPAGRTLEWTFLILTDHTRLVNTDKLKAEITEALPLSAVAAKLCDVELFDAGHQMKGCCPLHAEDTPSFYVNDAKGVFHCFGCKQGGDAIALVREVHHVSYREALALMAQAADVDIERFVREATPQEQQRDQFRAWCEKALKDRHYKEDTANRITDYAVCDEYEIGAWGEDQSLGTPPDYFREKMYLFEGVIFPYRNVTGKLVGWKARQPDKKMFGTPGDFPLAEPVVYGLHQARPHITDTLIIVEGEYDTASLVQAGIREVAGMSGSKWTDEQMEILRDNRIKRVVFLLDGDEAGRTAAATIAKRWWDDTDVEVLIALCPEGADPEDIVNAIGPDAIRDYVSRARGALEWLLWSEYDSKPRTGLSAKLEYVKWIQHEYGPRLTGLQESLILREVAVWLDVPEADVLDFARAEKSLLQAVDSEKVVLGKAMRDGNYYVATRKKIVADDFFVMKHKRIWQVLSELLADGLQFDLAVIKRRASVNGVDPEYVELLAEVSDVNIGWHEDQVIDFSVRRGAQADADRFREVIADLTVPANQLIGTLTHAVTSKALGRGSGAFAQISEQVDQAVETLHERMLNPDQVIGLDLGSQFPLLTRNLNGLQPRRVVLVAATSGVGKSTMTLQWLTGMAVHQAIPADFISLEMDTDEILFKMSSHLTGIDSHKIMGGRLTSPEAKAVEQAMLRIRRSPLRIYAPDGITPGEFVLYAREAVMERRTEVFVLDYAQMVGPDPEHQRSNRYEQLGHFAYTAKQKIARALDVCVVCCAQLKREAAKSEKPTPEDMGDSYDLVRAADVILLISESEDDGVHELWVGKNRQGPGNELIPISFDKPANTFREAAAARTPDYRISVTQ